MVYWVLTRGLESKYVLSCHDEVYSRSVYLSKISMMYQASALAIKLQSLSLIMLITTVVHSLARLLSLSYTSPLGWYGIVIAQE